MRAGKYKPHEITKWYLNRVERDHGDSLTHLKLQKLIYYSQAWHLANFGMPFFDEDFQAWAHGPVLLSVWNRFRHNGWEALPPAASAVRVAEEDSVFLERVHQVYSPLSAKALEEQTHKEAPWIEARGDLTPEAKCSNIINKRRMMEYYRERLNGQGEKEQRE